jgi:ATP-dependent RNA helicase MSS116
MKAMSSTMKAYASSTKFSSLPIGAETRRALAEVLRYEFCTEVQAQTLPPILSGVDCLAKAKTGTGKTLAFLIPSIEVVRKARATKPADGIMALILSPTRELASQIAAEAESLITFLPDLKIRVVFGGTNINADKKAIAGRVDFLVATPGR